MQTGCCPNVLFHILYLSIHTGAKIGSSIVDKLKEFNIAQKIISLTLDNVSTNNVAAEFLNSVLPLTPTGAAIFHNRCACHILNLIA